MTVVESFHSVLDRRDWSADDLREHLAQVPDDTLNDPSPFRDPPLVRVLQSGRCSAEVVRMLLDHGASVHCGAPLTVAARICGASVDAEKVVRELLSRGANAQTLDKFGQTCVCNALQARAPPVVFRLLLDAGCSPDLCRNHVSVLHCASFRPAPESGLSTDVLRMFLSAGANVLKFSSTGQSPLCFALRGGLDLPGLRMMLDAGASLDACGRHASTLVCATDQGWGRTLRADVLRALLRAGAGIGSVNGNGWPPLHLALRYMAYETDAVKALLDIPGVDVNGPGVGWKMDSLLHLAVHNSHCTLALVRLLLSRGAQLDKVNRLGDTPLHYAVANEDCQLAVIRFLLQSRAAVNARNKYNKSPLRIAIERERSIDVLHLLLGAGAKVGILKDKMDYSLLKLAVDLYEEKQARARAYLRERIILGTLTKTDSESSLSSSLERLKSIIAYSFLENAEVTMEYLSGRRPNSPELLEFSKKCGEEVKRMATMDIGRGRTLLEFLNSRSRCNKRPKSKYYKFFNLLATVSNFPAFFTVIAEKVGVESIKTSLRELRISTVKESRISTIEEYRIPIVNDYSGSIVGESRVSTMSDASGSTIDDSTDSKVETSRVSTVADSSGLKMETPWASTVGDCSGSTVDDSSGSTVETLRVFLVGDIRGSVVETPIVSTVDGSSVDDSSGSIVETSRVSTVDDCSCCTVEESCDRNCVEQRVFLNYECLCDVARYLSPSDLLRLVLAFHVPCKNAVAFEAKDIQRKMERSPGASTDPTEKQEAINNGVQINGGQSCALANRIPTPSCSKHRPTPCCNHKLRNMHEPYWKKKKKRKNSSFPSTSSDENHDAPPKRRQRKRKRTSRCKVPASICKKESDHAS